MDGFFLRFYLPGAPFLLTSPRANQLKPTLCEYLTFNLPSTLMYSNIWLPYVLEHALHVTNATKLTRTNGTLLK